MTTKLKTHLLFVPDILSSLYSFPFSLPPFLFSTGVLPLPPQYHTGFTGNTPITGATVMEVRGRWW